MFEYVRNNPRVVQIFLVLITLPFAFWGVESYVRNAGTGDDAASVGGSKISPQELQRALTEQEGRMRASLQGSFNPAMMDKPEVRKAVLDSLINQRLIGLHAAKSGLVTSDAVLFDFIQSIPAFQEDGKFSRERYDAYVASQNMGQAEFEARLRQDISLQQLLVGIREAVIPGRTPSDRWLVALREERELAETLVKPEQFTSQVKLGPDAAKTFYETNRKAFETPAQLRAEYVVLSRDALAAQVSVSDDDIKNWYQSHADKYRQNEERHASHILLRAAKDAPAAEVQAAQKKAEDVLAQLKKNPADFAKLAKQYSQDPGSAEKGGDLGWFARGMMVKAFEDAAFSLKENELSSIVRSDFGFHIIKVTEIRPERAKSLEQVRPEIAAELKTQAAAKKYVEAAEPFTNTVYEQSDSLKPAVDKFKLAVQQSPWLVKGAELPPPFNNPKLQAALFSDDAIKNKRNTEAIEVAPNTLLAARVLEYKPAALQPLEAVRADIEKRLTRIEATKLAQKTGEAELAKLVKGEQANLSWSQSRSVSRLGAPGLAPDALRAVFHTDVSKLPAYAGVSLPDGSYALYRISQVKPFAAGATDDDTSKMLRQQYERIIADQEFSAWLSALRSRYTVDINKEVVENKER